MSERVVCGLWMRFSADFDFLHIQFMARPSSCWQATAHIWVEHVERARALLRLSVGAAAMLECTTPQIPQCFFAPHLLCLASMYILIDAAMLHNDGLPC